MDLNHRQHLSDLLHDAYADDDGLHDRLLASLNTAADRSADLDAALRDALTWPRDLDGYLDYLADFARWIPTETGAEA